MKNCLRIRRNWLKHEEGATIIEFAIVAPVLFLIVFGIIEFSIVMFVSSAVESATFIGSRFGITGNTYAEYTGDYNDDNNDGVADTASREAFIRAEVEQRTFGLLDPSQLNVTSEPFANVGNVDRDADPDTLDAGSGGQAVLYEVTYDWPVLTPFAGFFAGEDGVYRIRSAVVALNEDF